MSADHQTTDIVASEVLRLSLDVTVRAADDYIGASKSANTVRAYKSDWAHFEGWCVARGLAPLPASPSTVVLYLAALPGLGLKTSTIRRRVATINQAHEHSGHEGPSRHREVRAVLQGIQRVHGSAPSKKKALGVSELRGLVATCPATLAGRRDRAILLLGFMGGFRRSELAAFDVSDVEFAPDDGVRTRVRRSKTDQAGVGRDVGIPIGKHAETCPVLAVRAWIDSAKLAEGALFRRVDRHGVVLRGRLTSHAIAVVVKRAAQAAGLDGGRYSGHSLRSGFCTSAARAGVSEHLIMRQSGHKSVTVLRGYVQSGGLFRENAASALDL